MIFPLLVRKMTGRLLRGHVVPVWILSQRPLKANNTCICTLWLLIIMENQRTPDFNFEDFNFVTTTHAPMQERGAKYGLEEY